MDPMRPTVKYGPETADAPAHKSRGEKLFNWLTYGGVSGVGVFVATVPFMYALLYKGRNANGENFYGRIENWMKSRGLSDKNADLAMKVTVTGLPGTAALIPTHYLERNKREIVTDFNQRLGDPTPPEAIAKVAEQNWLSLAAGRIGGWLAIFGSMKALGAAFGEEGFGKFERKFAETVLKPFGKATHIGGQETRAFRLGKIAAIDVFATSVGAALLYGVSHTVSARSAARKARREEQPMQEAIPLSQPVELPPARNWQNLVTMGKEAAASADIEI